jgi:endonuclease-3
MTATPRSKSIDKHEVIKQLLRVLKKKYADVKPKAELPVLESMLYSVCLENAFPTAAEQAYQKITANFHDLNEVRVSSIFELELLFAGMDQTEWRSMRLKNVLQHVFETNYSFEFESLRRKTLELATKHLNKIKGLTWFVKAYSYHEALGSHVLPVDDRMLAALIWLGLTDPGTTPEHAAEALRGAVRKADAPVFCHLLHCFANDSQHRWAFKDLESIPKVTEDETKLDTKERLERFFSDCRAHLRAEKTAKLARKSTKHAPAAAKHAPASRKSGSSKSKPHAVPKRAAKPVPRAHGRKGR